MKNDFFAHQRSTAGWLDQEALGSVFPDERLGKRFRTVLEQLANGSAQSIPFACQDWANTKAACRFFANERVTEEDILAGHFRSTRERFNGVAGAMLVLHDTTQLSYRRENIGVLNRGRRDRTHPLGCHPLCGLSMHSSLVVTQAGLPLGLAAIKFWTREAFKGTNALKRKINPTRVPIAEKESLRWLLNLQHATALLGDAARCVHVGDRESDIYELFCAAQDAGTHFLIRACANRRAEEEDGTTRIEAEMAEVRVKGTHRVEVRDQKGNLVEAVLELRYRRLRLLPPVAKQKEYQPVEVTVIHAQERGTPKNRDRIDWKLLTDLPVGTPDEAIEKLRWYALRWKIEVFHKILKSGCRVEASGLRTAERLVRLIAVCCILSWRVFWMTMSNRIQPQAAPTIALTQLELDLLDGLFPESGKAKAGQALGAYLVRLARMGGYLARSGDPVPGNTVMWRGLARLTDLSLGYALGRKLVGN
jgi:hypothetical protein